MPKMYFLEESPKKVSNPQMLFSIQITGEESSKSVRFGPNEQSNKY